MGTQGVAEFIAGTRYGAIPKEAADVARKAIIDYLGVAIAGINEPGGRILADYAKQMGAAREAGIIGGKFRTSAELAAWVNGTISHAIDYDDTFSIAAAYNMHPSVPILPAVFALGEKHCASGKDILTAYIVGIEVESRMGAAIGLKNSIAGWHPTAVLGALAAAAASANILKLSAAEAEMALGIAASLAGGLMRNVGSMTKPMHAGNAARNGVVAAELAQKGFTGMPGIFEGGSSFCSMFTAGQVADLGDADADLGKVWHIVSLGLAFKPYPSCRGTHASLDAALYLKERYSLNVEDVVAVVCNTHPRIEQYVKFPRPATGYQGKFSMQYCVATALRQGKVALEDFTDEKVTDASVQPYLQRITVAHPAVETKELDLGQEVRIRVKSGAEYSHRVTTPKGDPKNPMTEAEFLSKFRDCAKTMLSERKTEQVLDSLRHLEKVADISELAATLTGLRARKC